jgi:CRP-like cAMP-binding protein
MSFQAPPELVDKHAALRASQLLTEFTDVGLRIISEAAQQKSVGRGTYAFRGGDPSEALYFIAKGTLQLLPRDGGQPLGEIVAGDTLGGFSLLGVGGEHLLSAMAVNDVELLELSRPAFEQIKKSHPRTALKLTIALAQDLAERLREAKGPLREFLVWQISKRKP